MNALTLMLILLGKLLLSGALGYGVYRVYHRSYPRRLFFSFSFAVLAWWTMSFALLPLVASNDYYMIFINAWDPVVIYGAYPSAILIALFGAVFRSRKVMAAGGILFGVLFAVNTFVGLVMAAALSDRSLDVLYISGSVLVPPAVGIGVGYTVHRVYRDGYRARLFLSFLSGVMLWFLVFNILNVVATGNSRYQAAVGIPFAVTFVIALASGVLMALIGWLRGSRKVVVAGAMLSGALILGIGAIVLLLVMLTFLGPLLHAVLSSPES